MPESSSRIVENVNRKEISVCKNKISYHVVLASRYLGRASSKFFAEEGSKNEKRKVNRGQDLVV